MILHFTPIMFMEGIAGELVDERRCIEHPRLTILQQRQQHGMPIVTTFAVAGCDTTFHYLDDALDELRAHPMPGDICTVPPRPPRLVTTPEGAQC